LTINPKSTDKKRILPKNYIFVFLFPVVIDLLDIDLSALETFAKDWTCNQAVNEDCILSMFDLLLSFLIKAANDKKK